jgi:hypothetical protein
MNEMLLQELLDGTLADLDWTCSCDDCEERRQQACTTFGACLPSTSIEEWNAFWDEVTEADRDTNTPLQNVNMLEAYRELTSAVFVPITLQNITSAHAGGIATRVDEWEGVSREERAATLAARVDSVLAEYNPSLPVYKAR